MWRRRAGADANRASLRACGIPRASDSPAQSRNRWPMASSWYEDERSLSMRKLVYLVALAALAVPAFAVAASPGPADKAAAVKQCTTERTGMGAPAFKLLYGTNANRSNAFGKCVSKLATQNAKNRANAAASCRTERTADPAAFATKYGTGKK